MSIWNKRNSATFTPDSSDTAKKGKLIPMRRSELVGSKSIFLRMIEDCHKLGATDIFVGCEGGQTFSFYASGQSFYGVLPEGAVDALNQLSKRDFPILLDWDELGLQNLKLGMTTTGSAPVYCFSWNERFQLEPEVKKEEPPLSDRLLAEEQLVLIVDDDPRFSQILSRILEEQNFQTLIAHNGKEGLSVLQDFKPRLIITDIHMPNLSGPEFLLQSRKQGHDIPCLVLTNDEDALTEAEMVLLGATAYIRKSEDPRVLLAWCRRLTSLLRVS